ncbi:MAG: GDP-mannose 4,6-dehydratase [Bryobacteraceae bacterium]
MRILITGGAGFIGSHLAERLIKEGDYVTVIDDLSTGSMDNIAHLKPCRTFAYSIESVFNNSVVQELVDGADLIFHLAAAVGVRFIVESPVRTIETNVHGTEVVLRAAAKKKKHVVIASTSEVYGKSTAFPFKEDADLVMGATTVGRWSYACSKALDEFLGLAYWNEKKVPITVTRFFNTVGPRQTDRYGMVLPTFVKQALRGLPITIYGTGEQKRCFGHVSDVVEALFRISRSTNVYGEVINIGNDQEVSIAELAEKIKVMTGSNSQIVKIPYEEAYGPGFEDMFRRVPSLEKLSRLIGYRPHTALETIISSVADDLRYKGDEERYSRFRATA